MPASAPTTGATGSSKPDSGLRRLAADRDAGRGPLAQVFTTPPTNVEGTPASLLEYLRRFDFDRDAPKILATTAEYPVAAMDSMAPTDWRQPRLAQLQAAGSKLIAYHGASDGAFSLQATIDWYPALRMNNGGDVTDFARFTPCQA